MNYAAGINETIGNYTGYYSFEMLNHDTLNKVLF